MNHEARPDSLAGVRLPDRPVLVVEDDVDSRVMVATLLTAEGHRVVTAKNGLEGLAMTRQVHPCVILLDLMMPVMDGEEFRAEQLADPEIRDIPVVLVSASNRVDEFRKRLQAVGCVKKPIDFDQLVGEVTAACADLPDHPAVDR
jgi:CheY-like chemotaxis protein